MLPQPYADPAWRYTMLRRLFIAGYAMNILLWFLPSMSVKVGSFLGIGGEDLVFSTFSLVRAISGVSPGWTFFMVLVFASNIVFIVLAIKYPNRWVFISGSSLAAFLTLWGFFSSNEGVHSFLIPLLLDYIATILTLTGFFIKPPPVESVSAPPSPPAYVGFPCPNCNAQLKITPEMAGKRVICPRCRHEMRLPLPQAPTGVPPPQAMLRDITGTLVRVGTSGAMRRAIPYIILALVGIGALAAVYGLVLILVNQRDRAEATILTPGAKKMDLFAWSERVMPKLDATAKKSNAIALSRAKDEHLNEVASLKGNLLGVKLRVESVSRDGVYLNADYPCLIFTQRSNELDPDAHFQVARAALYNRRLIYLSVGKAISAEDASALTAGSTVLVHGVISKTTIEPMYHGHISSGQPATLNHNLIVELAHVATPSMYQSTPLEEEKRNSW